MRPLHESEDERNRHDCCNPDAHNLYRRQVFPGGAEFFSHVGQWCRLSRRRWCGWGGGSRRRIFRHNHLNVTDCNSPKLSTTLKVQSRFISKPSHIVILSEAKNLTKSQT